MPGNSPCLCFALEAVLADIALVVVVGIAAVDIEARTE